MNATLTKPIKAIDVVEIRSFAVLKLALIILGDLNAGIHQEVGEQGSDEHE